MQQGIGKNLNDTYLYSLTDNYQKNILRYVLQAERLDKKDERFKDLVHDISRRQFSSVVTTILRHPDVILMVSKIPLDKSSKVLCAKDLKQGSGAGLKVFIDCSDIIRIADDGYRCWKPDVLVSYLITAMDQLIYYTAPARITTNGVLTKNSISAFAKMYTHIVDFLFKISSVESLRNKCLYLSALYFQVNHLSKSVDENTKKIAATLAKLSDREANLCDIYIDEDSFKNIKTFIDLTATVLKLPKLTIEVFLDKWMFVYGTGTYFGLELYTSFASILTDSYVGAYINSQKTIEKIVGEEMIGFTKALLSLGGSVI